MLYKSKREEAEFYSVDMGLQLMLLFMDAYSQHYFNVELYLTGLIRTDDEQDDIYGDDESYQTNPWKSYHQLKMAGDLRYNLTFDQWAELLTITERLFLPLGFNCVVHTPENEEGWEPHVHVEVQVLYDEEYHRG